ncbi:MAG: MFS transporter [Syntrophales bacterium]|jgi:predicted MFS family arabinose efflux permease|nr:MFS transporter [Syntrophales bacterium]
MNNFPVPKTRSLTSSPYYIFALLFLIYMFDYMDRLVIVSLFPFIKQDWGLTDTQCGLLVSAVYWSILIFTLPVSIIIDRWSRVKIIGFVTIFWSVATVACAFTKNFGQLFAARTAIGIGEAGYAPGGTAMISSLFPKEKRARMLGFWNASIPLGSALGIALGGIIAERFGWRHAFGLVALPGIIVALLFFYVKDYQTVELKKTVGRGAEKTGSRMRLGEIAAHFGRSKTLIFNNLGFAANTFVTTALLTWLPSYFQRVEGISMSRASTKGGIVMLLAIIGAPLGGYLADRWFKSRGNARLLFPALSSFTTAVLLFIAFSVCRGQIQYAVLLAAGIAAVAFVPAAVAVTQDVVHPGLRAVSLSLCIIIQHILGSTLGPPVIGALSDAFGLEKAMVFLPLSATLAGIFFFIGSFFYDADASMVEKVETV